MSDKKTPIARYEDIDPILAALYLEQNIEPEEGVGDSNRKTSADMVAKWAHQMVKGNWRPTPEGIGFDVNGHLIEGQHRLKAIVEAGKVKPNLVVPMLVARNLPVDAKYVINIGRRRTMADFVTMNGRDKARLTAATVRLCLSYERGLEMYAEWKGVDYTPQDYVDFLNNPGNRFLGDALRLAKSTGKNSDLKDSPAAAGLFLTARIWGYETAYNFFEQVQIGANIPERSPAYALRSVLRSGRTRHAYDGIQELALYVKAFNRFLRDEPSEFLMWRIGQGSLKRADGRRIGSEKFPRILPRQ